jgi:membrane associated rhomboid family serine protease
MLILALLVVVGYALYVMSPGERNKLAQAVVARLHRLKDEAIRRRTEPEPFRDALRERTPLAIVTPALIGLNVLVFFFMLFGSGSLSDPETLVSWGGNFGPRTTNGEWWRLVAAMFVHTGFLHLLVNIAGLTQAGLMLERLAGQMTLVLVYLAAGILASLESLSSGPVDVTVGASGAIFGVYGLLVAALMWGLLQRPRVEAPVQSVQTLDLLDLRETFVPSEPSTPSEPDNRSLAIPLKALKELAPAAAIFFLYNALDGVTTAELSGLVAGFACGLVLARQVKDSKPPVFHVAAAMAATAVIVIASAALLRGVADVRPEMAEVVALEDRTARKYEAAVGQFKKGTLSAEALAQVIDKTIMPDLHAVQTRLKALSGVPQVHQPLVASAEEYLRLRDESWRLRAEGLHKRNMPTLQKAERPERAALEALQKIQPVAQKPPE